MRIGVIRYWVGRPAAEHETISRLKIAANKLNHEIVDIHPNGVQIGTQHRPDLNFIINLHFESAKAVDVPYYGALWNPLEFYHSWGFKQYWANQLSNDFLVSCGSESVDNYARMCRSDLTQNEFPTLNHTVPFNIIQPTKRNDRRLFYIGINWERATSSKGRFHDLLKALDEEGILDIYGPEVIDGIKPWKGFKGYKSQLPFDGSSVIAKVNQSGAALILSSDHHKKDNIMTSRLFEAIASGSSVISDSHPFIPKHFKNEVKQFNSLAPIATQVEEILTLLKVINDDEKMALENILATQEILEHNFSLENQLDLICKHYSENYSHNFLKFQNSLNICVIIIISTSNLEEINFAEKLKVRLLFLENQIRLGLIKEYKIFIHDANKLKILVAQLNISNVSIIYEVSTYLNDLDIKYGGQALINFLTGGEDLFQDYYTSIANSYWSSNFEILMMSGTLSNDISNTNLAFNPKIGGWRDSIISNYVVHIKVITDFINVVNIEDLFGVVAIFFNMGSSAPSAKFCEISKFKFTNFNLNLGTHSLIDIHKTQNRILFLNHQIVENFKSQISISLIESAKRFNSSNIVTINQSIIYKQLATILRHSFLPEGITNMIIRIGKKIIRVGN